ncbi:OmpW family outer membrane protein [Galbibacter mesophilus]|uniref:OmpW family outer membrane protein n=1 Tax=Galbibacter mesophilus TaxID=379069 RepID=UPI00191D74C2|nr:OmpW family outer membrane protein [Galbibacter mesophilus]MCM5661426.1 porin family protein [Galbibacter mesophilus]
MKKIITIIIFCLVSLSLTAQSIQMKSIASINYSVGVPTGNLNDFISRVSGSGFSLDYKRMVAPNIYLGGELGYNYFSEEKGYNTYTEGTASVSGFQTRYNASIPMTITADYVFTDNSKIKPYVGLGIGTIYNNREVDLGLFASTVDTWFFTIKPEAGIIYNLNSYTGIKFSSRYYQTFDSKDLDGYSYLAFDIGFVFMTF